MINSNMNDASPETADDRELEELLTDAFDAPPVPRSLLKQLEQRITEEWGTSPGLVNSSTSRLQRILTRSGRWARGLPVAAAIAVIAVCLAVFNQSSTAYAWSAMLEALSRHGIVELRRDGVTRWLSLSDLVVSESSAEAVVLLDMKNHVLLRRPHHGTMIERKVLEVPLEDARNRLMFAFLAGDLQGMSSGPSASVAELGGSEVVRDGRVYHRMDFRLTRNESMTGVQVLVDPEKNLPVACSVEVTSVEEASQESAAPGYLPLIYATDIAATRLAAVFPESMPVVDMESDAGSSGPTGTASAEPPVKDEPVVAATNAIDVNPPRTAEVRTDTPDAHEVSPLFGAASKWKAVEIELSPTGNPVTDLDLLMETLWQQNNITPAVPASDEELLRRVYLDLAGRTPGVNEVRDYLEDTSPNRYETLVDRLLSSPDHASHLAARFRSFLIPEGVDLSGFGGVEAFEKWLAERFQSNESYDRTVRSLLLAEGRLVQSGPLLFYSATKLEANQLAGRTARVFLGMRLECAQCHDHPFEPWTQEDFWGFAAFFARISRPRGKLENVSTVMQVRDVDRGEVMMPESAAPVPPKFLNADDILEDDNAAARRERLTQWLTSRDNPYFARATANRVWSMMFGRGIVNPVDDFGVGNPPLSPELLDSLAGRLIQSQFNLRDLFRVVALSKAYRLSSGSEELSDLRQEWFAQMNVKMLTAEQVFDCITVATMPGSMQNSATEGLVARFGNVSRDEFLREFRTPSGRATEYQGGIPQALTLMNGSLIDSATGLASSGLLKSLEAPFFTRDQRIEILYFATLSRHPKPAEKELLDQYITESMSGGELREALSDVLWALLNSAEFTMNH